MRNIKKEMIDSFLSIHLPVCVTKNDGKIIFINNVFSDWLAIFPDNINETYFIDLFIIKPKSLYELKTEIFYVKNVKNKAVPTSIPYVFSFPKSDIVFFVMIPINASYSITQFGDRAILEMIPISAAFLDETGGIICMNHILKKRIQSESDEYIPISNWVDEKDKSFIIKTLNNVRKKNEVSEPILLHLKDNMNGILTFFKYFRSYDEGPGRFLVIFDEFMGEKLFNTNFNAKDAKDFNPEKMQLLGQLSSGIVHDFNNLLTGIMGFCDLLLQQHTDEDSSFKDIMQIKQSAQRAAKLIQQLLAFSKSSIPSMDIIDVNYCIQELSPLIRRMIGPKILLTIVQKTPIKNIYADKVQIEQIILNLAINARDSMVNGGSLTFTLKSITMKHPIQTIKKKLSPGDYTIIEVSDTGTGIAEEYLNKIFDPFFSTKDPGSGTGLGLSNVLQIVDLFSGGISVKTKIGLGTTFSLYFPSHSMTEDKCPEKTVEKIIDNSCATAKILLVDDEDAVRLFASRALKAKGHEVIEARDGHNAVHLLSQHNDIEIVISDVMMPGVDGPLLANIIKKNHKDIKILFVSGYPEDEVITLLPKDISDIFFLQKPFALGDLVEAVKKILYTDESNIDN